MIIENYIHKQRRVWTNKLNTILPIPEKTSHRQSVAECTSLLPYIVIDLRTNELGRRRARLGAYRENMHLPICRMNVTLRMNADAFVVGRIVWVLCVFGSAFLRLVTRDIHFIHAAKWRRHRRHRRRRVETHKFESCLNSSQRNSHINASTKPCAPNPPAKPHKTDATACTPSQSQGYCCCYWWCWRALLAAQSPSLR